MITVDIVSVKHYDGYNHSSFDEKTEYESKYVGWHILLYTDHPVEFNEWISNNCTTAYCNLVQTSDGYGHTRYGMMLHITDQHEAVHFLLKWN